MVCHSTYLLLFWPSFKPMIKILNTCWLHNQPHVGPQGVHENMHFPNQVPHRPRQRANEDTVLQDSRRDRGREDEIHESSQTRPVITHYRLSARTDIKPGSLQNPYFLLSLGSGLLSLSAGSPQLLNSRGVTFTQALSTSGSTWWARIQFT